MNDLAAELLPDERAGAPLTTPAQWVRGGHHDDIAVLTITAPRGEIADRAR